MELLFSRKTNIEGGWPKKVTWTVVNLTGEAWQERGGAIFEGWG